MGEAPPCAEVDAAGLGEQQLEVGFKATVDEEPGHERPHLVPVEIGETRVGGSGHPHCRIGMEIQETAGSKTSLRALGGVEVQGVEEALVVPEQVIRARVRGARGGDRAGHDSTSLARAHSEATVSGARCT